MNPKHLLDTYEIAPKKGLGQNFLQDPHILERIVSAAELTRDSHVLEIGPGTGALTVALAQTHAHIVALEIDDRLMPILERELSDFRNVTLRQGDILKTDPADLMGDQDYVVVANLPYYITSPILRRLLEETRHKPRRLVVTVQQEVAERIVAKPGDMSILAVSVQFYGTVQIVTRINPAAFYPRPDVASAVLRIDLYEQPALNVDESRFFEVVRAGFGQKRKQIKNALGAALGVSHTEVAHLLSGIDIDPKRRAETLTIDEWGRLTDRLTHMPNLKFKDAAPAEHR